MYCAKSASDCTASDADGGVDAAPSHPAFVQMSAGANHACGVTAGGSLYCWGDNEFGQLGIPGAPDQSTFGIAVPTPTKIVDNDGHWAQVSAGTKHTCATTMEGGALCWGDNSFNEVSPGSDAILGVTSVYYPTGTESWNAVAAGDGFSCGISVSLSDLTTTIVQCWGRNDLGQMGNGNAPNSNPTPGQTDPAVPLNNARQIAANNDHVCVLVMPGNVYCWGNNSVGQVTPVGVGSIVTSPVVVPPHSESGGSGQTFKTVSTGYESTCGVLSDGTINCWGNNVDGALGVVGGNGVYVESVPAPLNGSWTEVAAGRDSAVGSRRGLVRRRSNAGARIAMVRLARRPRSQRIRATSRRRQHRFC